MKSKKDHERYTFEQVEAIGQLLKKIPPKNQKTFSRRDIVKKYIIQIRFLHESGQTFSEIADALKAESIRISAATLATYFYEIVGKAKKELKEESTSNSKSSSRQKDTVSSVSGIPDGKISI
jgi:DNA-binding transcriptional MerR regulator